MGRVQPTSILDRYVEEDEMTKLNGVDRHYTSFPQITSPVLVGVFVVDPILDIVWQKVLKLQRCSKFETCYRIFSVT